MVHAHQIGLADKPPRTEMLICLSADGSYVIDAAVGETDKVQLTQKMEAAVRSNEGCRLVHNHPAQGSLSAADWRLALAHSGILEVVAVNSRLSVFRGAPIRPFASSFQDHVEGSDLAPVVADAVFKPHWDRFTQSLSPGLERRSPQDLEERLEWV